MNTRFSSQTICLVLMGVCLLGAGCGANDKVEAEAPTPRTASRPVESPAVQRGNQDRPLSESLLPRFEQADKETVRLQPRAFENLPPAIVEELDRRNCTIPQVYTEQRQGNVITGHFTAAGQVDLAVLCSRERVSSILVFRNSSQEDVAELASLPDLHYLQTVGEGRIGYSRALAVADQEYIRSHYEAYGSLKPPPLDHEGINDAFVEKGSDVWYWYDGQWMKLAGAD